MWLPFVSVLLSSSIHCSWSQTSSIVTAYDTQYSDETEWDAHWTCTQSGYWISGQSSHHNNHREDRRFIWTYRRPEDSNTDYSYTQPTQTLSTTSYRQSSWTKTCNAGYAIYSIESNHDNDEEDRWWKIKCKQLPAQFSLLTCAWQPDSGWDSVTTWANGWDADVDHQCNNGVLKGIETDWRGDKRDRRFRFNCCRIRNTPIDISSSYDEYRVLTEITSAYTDGTRTIASSRFGKPNWYRDGGDIVDEIYSIENTLPGVHYLVRVCSQNGAFTRITYNAGSDRFSFECAKFINQVTMHNCQWSDYLNDFHSGFTGSCSNDGAIRGIQGYYSPASNDRRFKIYCCVFKRQTYTANTAIIIKAKTDTVSGSHSGTSNTRFDLCWNNRLYQGHMILNANNRWFTTSDVVEYDSCGNDRMITVSMTSTNNLRIQSIGVQDNGADYIIDGFNVYDANTAQTTHQNVFVLDTNGVSITDVVVQFPDDYITACTTTCDGTLYELDDYQQYLITITKCSSFSMGDGTPEVGMILRGINGNLDKATLTGPSFVEIPIGQGNIGDLIHVNFEYESGPDICIQSVVIHNPYGDDMEFNREHFGDGIILSDDCDGDDFEILSGVQYVPCYDKPYGITTYERSTYTSVQIHLCTGGGGPGITPTAQQFVSVTIVGISTNDKFISSDALSLKTPDHWYGGTSRDFTLPISGEFDKVILITITNNDASDAMCVDSVLINGADAFLSHYWVGPASQHDSLRTIPAVTEWPICAIELTTTLSTSAPLPVDPVSVATSTCVNRNRLLSVECEISQTFETYEEVSWEQQTGEEVTTEITMEGGTETSVSGSVTGSYARESTTGVEGVSSTKHTIGVSVTAGGGRTWTSSTSETDGTTTIDVTTDGTVDGETIGVECSGSASVPPSQQISYSLIIDHSAVTIETLTDIKMTKCSAYLYGEDYYDPNDYIYVYGIIGELIVTDATNCYVEFSQTEQVSPQSITCAEERVLATREWGTYVAQCDESDPTMYMKCQCAIGDALSLPTCGCVDETTGNLLDTAAAAVVAETDTYKWQNWCEEYCGSGSYNAAKVPSTHIEPDSVNNKMIKNDKKGVFSDYKSISSSNGLLVVAMLGIMLTYMINSCISCYKQCPRTSVNKYQAIAVFDTDTDVEKAQN